MDRYGRMATRGHLFTVVSGRLMVERRVGGMLETCASMPMEDAVEAARWVLSMTGPIAHEQAALDAG